MNKLSKKPGMIMLTLAWVTALALLAQYFSAREDMSRNPNYKLNTMETSQFQSVTLEPNRKGHYVFTGKINGVDAEFMLDTGATDVVIPAALADDYQLTPVGKQMGITANGIIEIEKSWIDKLSIGQINLYNVRASINPGMTETQAILLGMSAIKYFELNQTNNTLTLTHYHN